MARLLKYIDKVALGVCVALFLASAVFAGIRFRQLDAIAARNPVVGIPPVAYERQTARLPVIDTVFWPDPAPQSRGREWVYDVFTPPVIYYNRETGEFTVTPPSASEQMVARSDVPFEVELVAVRQEPYRVQLVGYVGAEEGTPLATFELLETGETVVGRQGREFERGQFTLQAFDIRKVVTNPRDSMPVVETVGVAVIQDNRTGREETLTTRERKMLPRLQAVLRLRTNPPEQRVIREGGSVLVNGYSYLVTQLSLNPAQAVISRRAPDSLGASETRTLTPIGPGGGAPGGGENRPASIFSFSSP